MKTMSQLFRKSFLIGLVLSVVLLVGCGESFDSVANAADATRCAMNPTSEGCPDLNGDGYPG